MLDSLAQVSALSREWDINEEDVLFIALNHCGVKSSLPKSRMRFRLRLDSRPEEEMYFILSLGRTRSPFSLEDGEIRLHGERIAEVSALEDDDAVLGYFRNGHKVLTLNSHARSQCTGCAFCPNTLEAAADPRLAALDDLTAYFSSIVSDFQLGQDMSAVEKVTVCTGCFHYESLALEHLRQVRAAMTEHNCAGYIHFLSSVVRTEEGLDALAETGPFHLTITAECFTRRNVLLKESKAALTPDQMVQILGGAKDRGVLGDYTYIVGLDPPDVALKELTRFVPVTTTFPRFQVYQPHNEFMDIYAADGARDLEFYLYLRKGLEDLFKPTGLRPQSWENYRPLWYFTFADEELVCPRI
jgi:hypothetical protein